MLPAAHNVQRGLKRTDEVSHASNQRGRGLHQSDRASTDHSSVGYFGAIKDVEEQRWRWRWRRYRRW